MLSNEDVHLLLQQLVAHPREELDTELKGWLDLTDEAHRADLAHAMLALANHGGGHILIGFAETGGAWQPDTARPADLSVYNQDAINGIIQRYAEPAFHVSVHHVRHLDTGEPFPVIRVPGEHTVPVMARRDGPNNRHVRQHSVYIRRLGPRSETPQTAQEWRDLFARCIRSGRDELLDTMRRMLYGIPEPSTNDPVQEAYQKVRQWEADSKERFDWRVFNELPDGDPHRYALGTWRAAYGLFGDFEPPPLPDFLEILRSVKGHETGWPVWSVWDHRELGTHPYDGLIETWLAEPGREGAASDFWRASPEGLLFLLRGYQEDATDNLAPGRRFDVSLPVWRVGEVLLHAERLALALAGPEDTVVTRFAWDGLKGRELVAWASPLLWIHDGRTSHQSLVVSEWHGPASVIGSNLPEIVANITRPLYEAFDFFSLPMQTIQTELTKMRAGWQNQRV